MRTGCSDQSLEWSAVWNKKNKVSISKGSHRQIISTSESVSETGLRRHKQPRQPKFKKQMWLILQYFLPNIVENNNIRVVNIVSHPLLPLCVTVAVMSIISRRCEGYSKLSCKSYSQMAEYMFETAPETKTVTLWTQHGLLARQGLKLCCYTVKLCYTGKNDKGFISWDWQLHTFFIQINIFRVVLDSCFLLKTQRMQHSILPKTSWFS